MTVYLKTDTMSTQPKWKKSYEIDIEPNMGLVIDASSTHELTTVKKPKKYPHQNQVLCNAQYGTIVN